MEAGCELATPAGLTLSTMLKFEASMKSMCLLNAPLFSKVALFCAAKRVVNAEMPPAV